MIDYTLPLDQLPDPLPIEPLERPFDVTITPPGSKSITNRAYVLAALADGESRIIRPLRSEDTDGLLEALCTLGAQARWDGEDVFIKGVNGRFPRGGSVNLGDGGTPTRFMIAAACLAAEPVVVDGSKRMRERPIAEGVDMLRKLGATIEYVEAEGRLPVRIVPSENFKGGELTVGKTASSQFISAVMLIGWALPLGIHLRIGSLTSESYVALTVDAMRQFRIRVKRNLLSRVLGGRLRWIGAPHQYATARSFDVEADASSALYWALAAKLVKGSRVVLEPLPIWTRQPDRRAILALSALGGNDMPSENDCDGIFVEGPTGDYGKRLNLNCRLVPDGSMALSIAAIFCREHSQFTGLHTLRVKETDRIAALANELRKVGCAVETTDDSITITPPTGTAALRAASHDSENRGTHPVTIETYNDHRMAMSFAVLGLVRPGISIANPKCVAKSYPTFWRDFAKLYQGSPGAGGGAGG